LGLCGRGRSCSYSCGMEIRDPIEVITAICFDEGQVCPSPKQTLETIAEDGERGRWHLTRLIQCSSVLTAREWHGAQRHWQPPLGSWGTVKNCYWTLIGARFLLWSPAGRCLIRSAIKPRRRFRKPSKRCSRIIPQVRNEGRGRACETTCVEMRGELAE